MKYLKDILNECKTKFELFGSEDQAIAEMELDSRKLKQDYAFVAFKGAIVDGHKYIDQAIVSGAKVIICSEKPELLKDGISYVVTEDIRTFVGEFAKVFYANPSGSFKLIGVTGTNGKTTVASLLYQLFLKMGFKVGLVSTVGYYVNGQFYPSTHTTPDVLSLNKLMVSFREAKCDYVFMEVSSHAVDQKRIEGLSFQGGIFTNLSHDHLDYHKTFRNYLNTKKKFFDELVPDAFAIVNIDDRNGSVMAQNTKANVLTYGLKHMADYKAKLISNSIDGIQMEVDGMEVYFKLVGEFNAYNLLAVYAAANALGFEKEEVCRLLSEINPAEGRFERIFAQNRRISAIVDYAHTPDALLKVLITLQDLKGSKGRIITVVGCGGDRDKTKRAPMAGIAHEFSEMLILTSDNPRSEDPKQILEEMKEGLPDNAKNVFTNLDREEAIKMAVHLAEEGDIILVAGKGHEKYQEINGVKHPFDDKEKLKAFML